MASEKKWMTVIVEINTYDGEVQHVLPVYAEVSDYFTYEELKKIYAYMREADDASFDFMWDFRTLLRESLDELEPQESHDPPTRNT
jgi:hypothetical protein